MQNEGCPRQLRNDAAHESRDRNTTQRNAKQALCLTWHYEVETPLSTNCRVSGRARSFMRGIHDEKKKAAENGDRPA